MIKNFIFLLACFVMISSCQPTEKKQSSPAGISETTITGAIKAVQDQHRGGDFALLEKGVRHAASL